MVTVLAQTTDRNDNDQNFRQRIDDQARTKLYRQERQALAVSLIAHLIQMAEAGTDTPEAIQQLCQAEVSLLEEGYPSTTIQSYLAEYIQLLSEAIARGELPLTEQNSYQPDGETSRRHYAFNFLTYPLASIPTHAHSANTLMPLNLEGYLIRLETLLISYDPIELIIAIIATTGRPLTDVIALAQFHLTPGGDHNHLKLQEHPYLLRFSGRSSPTSARVTYDLLTLLPAIDILKSINKLREQAILIELERQPYDASRMAALAVSINQHIDTLFGATQLVPPITPGESVTTDYLQELYGAIAVYFFCPQSQSTVFYQDYLNHIVDGFSKQTVPRFRYSLMSEGEPLNGQGSLIPSVGLLPRMVSNREPEAEGSSLAIQCDEEVSMENELREMSATLQMIARQQAETIETQARTIAELQAQNRALSTEIKLMSGIPELLTPPSNDDLKRISELEASLAEVIAERDAAITQQRQAEQQADDYQRQLAKIKKMLGSLPDDDTGREASGDTKDEPEAIAPPQPTQDNSQQPQASVQTRAKAKAKTSTQSRKKAKPSRKRSAKKKQATPKQPTAYQNRRRSEEDSIAYQRALRVWEITKQWNADHNYEKAWAIQLSKSYLARHFSINQEQSIRFWEDHAEELAEENQRLGVQAGSVYFNRGKKQQAYLDHVLPILEQEGLMKVKQ